MSGEWDCEKGCCVGFILGYFVLGSGDCVIDSDQNESNPNQPDSISQVVQVEDSLGVGGDSPKPSAGSNALVKAIESYQRNTSPAIKEELGVDHLCKFKPSCSEYAKQAIEKHGTVRGSLMAAGRLARCNPLSKGGYDPVKD